MSTEVAQRLSRVWDVLTSRVPLVLSDPRSYPRETMVLAVACSVLLVLVVMVVLVIRQWLLERAVRAKLGLRRRPEWLVRRWLGAIALAGLVVLVVIALPMVPAAGRACAACHVIEPAVDSWSAGSHATVACAGCHARPGLAGSVEAWARGTSALMTGGGRPAPDSGACAGCHSAVLKETVLREGLAVSHKEIAAAAIPCLSCHPGVGHAGRRTDATSKAPVTPSVMAMCIRCHDGRRAPAQCQACHVGRSPSDKVTRAQPVGRTPAPPRCDGCHKRSTDRKCIECHGLEMPHPASFAAVHASTSASDPALCASCHDGASRADSCACHDESNLHGTYTEWYAKHMQAGRRNGPGGCRCHDQQFCGFCHPESPWQ